MGWKEETDKRKQAEEREREDSIEEVVEQHKKENEIKFEVIRSMRERKKEERAAKREELQAAYKAKKAEKDRLKQEEAEKKSNIKQGEVFFVNMIYCNGSINTRQSTWFSLLTDQFKLCSQLMMKTKKQIFLGQLNFVLTSVDTTLENI